MIYELNSPVCPKCSHNEVSQGCQVHDDTGEFRTKEWWRAHPEAIKPSVQKAVAISDPTDYTCKKCNHEFTPEEIQLIIAPLVKLADESWIKNGCPMVETPGIAIFNPRVLKSLTKSSK